jgi:hypothetical protein
LDISRTYVDNTATATALYGSFVVTSNPDSEHTFVPELQLKVLPNPTSVTALNQTITYTYYVRNRTSKSMSNIRVVDSRVGSFDCLATLAPESTEDIPCSSTKTYSSYTQADMNAGTFSSQVSATAQGGVVSNPVTVPISVTQSKVLTLTKTVGLPLGVVEPVPVGTVLTYGYSFKNEGNVDFTGPYTLVDNRIPGNHCSAVTGTLSPLQTKTCANALYTVSAQDFDAGSIVNSATVKAMVGGIQWSSLPVTKTVITFEGARLGLIKSAVNTAFPLANPTYFTGLQTLTYSFKLVNTGGVELSQPYTVNDQKVPSVLNCPGATGTIPVGGSTSCSGTYPITADDNTLERVDNSAWATANSSSGIVTSTTPADLTVKKFVCNNVRLKHTDPTPLPGGSNITWTIVNNTNLPVHIASIAITWTVPGPNITQVTLQGYPGPIWTGNSSIGGLIVGPVPSGGWLIPNGNTNMGLQFQSAATGVRIQITFTEAGCPGVDSNVPYGG